MFPVTLAIFCGALMRTGFSNGGFEMPFGCGGRTASDQTRQQALSLINGVRSSVALGEFQAQNSLPSASDMRKLRWDCNLEAEAQRSVRNCPIFPPRSTRTNGMNYQYFRSGTFPSILRNPIESAVLQWTAIKNSSWPADNVFSGNAALRNFANLIRANTTAVGCSSVVCYNRASAACVFSQPSVEAGALVYTPGNPCQNDGECTAFSPAFCESGLCVNSVRPTTTAPTTATINPQCPSTPFRRTVLQLHNDFRSLVAVGLAYNGGYFYAPECSRMTRLEYDCEAEQLAINHVKTCDRNLSSPASRPGYQENIHVSAANDASMGLWLAFSLWSNELDMNGIPSNMIFTSEHSQRQLRKVTMVSKIIWGTNRHVGCATQQCDGFHFTSCMYREPVNVVGQNIYTVGEVCSTCPGGLNNCDPAVGLCSS